MRYTKDQKKRRREIQRTQAAPINLTPRTTQNDISITPFNDPTNKKLRQAELSEVRKRDHDSSYQDSSLRNLMLENQFTL